MGGGNWEQTEADELAERKRRYLAFMIELQILSALFLAFGGKLADLMWMVSHGADRERQP